MPLKGPKRVTNFPQSYQQRDMRYLINFLKKTSFISNFTFSYPSRPNPEGREKSKLNFYLHISLRFLKRFYEGLVKTF